MAQNAQTMVDQGELCVVFDEVQFVEPLGALLIAETLRDLVVARKAAGHTTGCKIDHERRQQFGNALSYLDNLGFFRYVHLRFGRSTNATTLNPGFLPLQIIDLEALEGGRRQLHEAIGEKANQLSNILCHPDSPESIMVSYALREVIRNVFEHAETDRCVLAGQRWSNGYAEIAICDRGIGVYRSLAPTHNLGTAREALEHALRPGISRILEPGPSPFGNSGFGLYMLSEMAKPKGAFALISSGRYLRMTNGRMSSSTFAQDVTAVGIKFGVGNADYFPNVLKQLVAAGEQAYYETTGTRKSASGSSTLPPERKR